MPVPAPAAPPAPRRSTFPHGLPAIAPDTAPALERAAAVGDRWMLVFTAAHFALALLLAPVHGTWRSTLLVGGAALVATWTSVWLAPRSFRTRCIAGLALQTFCALHIHQMQGLAEMHFFFFTSVTALIIYQDWRALWPGVLGIVAQHSLFSWWHNLGLHPGGTRFFVPTHVSAGTIAFHFGIALGHAAVASWWARTLRRQTIAQAMATSRAAESEARVAGIIDTAMDAIVTADAEQRIVRVNAAAERMFGWRAADVLGQPLECLVPERHHAMHRAHVAAFGARATSGEPADVHRRMGPTAAATRSGTARPYLTARRHDGGEFPIEASISALATARGPQYTVILRDVSERVRAQAERERLATVLDATPDAVSIYRPGEGLLYANAPARALLRIDAVGPGVEPDLTQVHAPDELAWLLGEAYPAAARDGTWLGTSHVRHPDGTLGTMSHLVLARRDAAGAVESLITLQRDITAQQRTEAALRAVEARFRAAIDGSTRAHLVLRAVRAAGADGARGRIVDFDVVDANPAAAALLGTALDDLVGSRLLELFPLARDAGLFGIYASALETGLRYDGDAHLSDPRLAATWLRLLVVPLGDAEPDAIAVTARDVTAEKAAERRLAESEARLQLIYQSTSDAMFLLRAPAARDAATLADPAAYRIESVNEAYRQVECAAAEAAPSAPSPLADPVGQTIATLLPPDAARAIAGHCAAAVRGGQPVDYERPFETARGARTFATRLSPIVDAAGVVTHLLGVAHDVTEQRRAEAALHEQSTRDELTGLLNRRGLRPLAEQALVAGQRLGRHDAMLYVDLDRFKPINDTWGHAAGDAALQAAARVLRDVVRAGDLVARLGGDEFGVLALGLTHPGEGAAIARRLDAALAAHNAREGAAGRPWSIGWSIGVAGREPGDDLDALMARADAALYARKGARR